MNNVPSRAAHASSARLPMPMQRHVSAHAPAQRVPYVQTRVARSTKVSTLAPSPSADVRMASPPCFHIGTAPVRRAETPLQRHHRVNHIRRATPARGSRQCAGVPQPPPRTPREPFVSPSLRTRFPVSVQSAAPRIPTAKTRLDFGCDGSAAPGSTARARAAPATPVRRKDPRLIALVQRIQRLMDHARWQEALNAIDEALALDPDAAKLRTDRAIAHNRLVMYVVTVVAAVTFA